MRSSKKISKRHMKKTMPPLLFTDQAQPRHSASPSFVQRKSAALTTGSPADFYLAACARKTGCNEPRGGNRHRGSAKKAPAIGVDSIEHGISNSA
jgi:hypothetical protein